MTRDSGPEPPCICDPPVSHTEPEPIHQADDWPDQLYDSAGIALLDPQETTVTEPNLVPSALQSDADRSLARSFRHSGWARQRQQTHRALGSAGFAPPRIRRFDQCGSTAFVLATPGPEPAYRIASNRCHDRFCIPCALEKRRIVAANLTRNLPEQPLRLITLTLKSSTWALGAVLDRLYGCFRKLRSTLYRRQLLVGGIAFLEITRNERTGAWHPHLHIICQGRYISRTWLRDAWLKITGDSFIVDIRLIYSPSEAAAYVVKYASKSLSPKVWNHPAALAEAVRALSGKRTFNCFGTWVGFNLSHVPTSDLEWQFLDTLPNLIRRYKSGERQAQVILSALTNGDYNDPPPSDLFDFP